MSARKPKPAATPGTAGPGTASGRDQWEAERAAKRFAERVERYVEMQLVRRAPDAKPSEVVSFAYQYARLVDTIESGELSRLLDPALTEGIEAAELFGQGGLREGVA